MKGSFLVKHLFLFFLGLVFTQSSLASNLDTSQDHVKKISAEYQVKTSFFALPIKAKISVELIEPGIYVASVKLKSPFFKVVQSEKARIQQCSLELISIDSLGDRIGAKSWDEHVEVNWPEKFVSYRDDGEQFPVYQAEFLPTGFVSLFAHQYISYFKQENEQSLTYTQSKKGWRINYENKGLEKSVSSKFYKDSVDAIGFIIPRDGMKTDDIPSIWYVPDKLGSFPLRMSMKIGVFNIDVQLKSLNANEQEISSFFRNWAC